MAPDSITQGGKHNGRIKAWYMGEIFLNFRSSLTTLSENLKFHEFETFLELSFCAKDSKSLDTPIGYNCHFHVRKCPSFDIRD